MALRARAIAAGLSLFISTSIVGTIAVAIALVLHTLPFFWATGGIRLIAIVALVDIVLGPLLVFLVYDRRKQGLRRDLAVIASIQLAAITYGIHASVVARPVFMTFVVDRFELVSAAEVDDEELARAPDAFRQLTWGGPMLAAARMPESQQERERLLFESVSQGIDLRHLLRYYVDFDSLRSEVLASSRPITELERYNDRNQVAAALAPIRASVESAAELRYLPVQGLKEDLVALIDGRNATVLGTVRLNPWEW